MDVLGGIEAQAIQMEVADPIGGVGAKELADRPAIRAIEIDGGTPIGVPFFRKISRRILRQVVAIGAQVVVDDIEDDADA